MQVLLASHQSVRALPCLVKKNGKKRQKKIPYLAQVRSLKAGIAGATGVGFATFALLASPPYLSAP